jgi:hypothetical protein
MRVSIVVATITARSGSWRRGCTEGDWVVGSVPIGPVLDRTSISDLGSARRWLVGRSRIEALQRACRPCHNAALLLAVPDAVVDKLSDADMIAVAAYLVSIRAVGKITSVASHEATGCGSRNAGPASPLARPITDLFSLHSRYRCCETGLGGMR